MARPTFTPPPVPDAGSVGNQGNPSQPTGSEAGAQNQQVKQPAYVTEDALAPALEKALAGIRSKEQQAADKREARINQQFDKLTKMIQASQTQIPETERGNVTDALRKMATELVDGLPPDSQPASASQALPSSEQGNDGGSPDPITAAAWQIMDAQGIEIDEADPEVTLIDWTDQKTAMSTTIKAIEAKQRRLANAGLPLGGGTPGKPDHVTKPVTEVLDGYFDKLLPRG